MLTARHAVDDCIRVVVSNEGYMWPARVVKLSVGTDLALIKVPKTLGLSAIFPRTAVAAVNDLMFAASYDNLPAMVCITWLSRFLIRYSSMISTKVLSGQPTIGGMP